MWIIQCDLAELGERDRPGCPGRRPAGRFVAFGVVAALAVELAGGCKKAGQETGETPPPGETVARVHWLGFDRVGAETNAARFMTIWNEPESKKLAAQTLDKLALFLASDTNVSPTPNPNLNLNPFRPLLDDLLRAESYVEVRAPAGQPGELALAIRLNPERAALWATNLPSALATYDNSASLERRIYAAGSAPVPSDDQKSKIENQNSPKNYQLLRAGDWTLLGLATQPANALLADFAARIQRDRAPFAASATNFWLAGELDLPRAARALALDFALPTNTPTVTFDAIGDGEFVITRAGLSFPQPLPIALEPWTIPTNLVQGQLISFTAARSLAPWLGKLKLFSGFAPADVPSQVYVWGDKGLPFQTFFALPVANAANALALLARPIMDYANPRILPNCGTITFDATNNTMAWNGLPHCNAFLEAETNSVPQFLHGGFAPQLRPNPMPPEIVAHILEGTNLVYFDWEIAGEMLLHCRYLDDVYRIVFDNGGPRLSGTPSLAWVATNLTTLTHCVTEVRLEPANRLSFARKSTVGLDGLELDALANWLELPDFPRGLTTFMYTNPAPPSILLKIRHAKVKN